MVNGVASYLRGLGFDSCCLKTYFRRTFGFNMTIDGNIETFKWRKKSTIVVLHAWDNSSLNKVFMGAKRLHLMAAIKAFAGTSFLMDTLWAIKLAGDQNSGFSD